MKSNLQKILKEAQRVSKEARKRLDALIGRRNSSKELKKAEANAKKEAKEDKKSQSIVEKIRKKIVKKKD